MTCFIFLFFFFFKKNHGLFKKAILQKRLMFIDEECKFLIVINDGGELVEISNERRRFTIAFYNSL